MHKELRPFLIALVVLVGLGLGIGQYVEAGRVREVTLTVDGETREVAAVGSTVGDMLDRMGVKYPAGSILEPARDTRIEEGMEISLRRMKTIALYVDGEGEKVKTTAGDVGEFLNERKIELGSDDVIYPDATSKLKDQMILVVTHVGVKNEEVEETIPMHIKLVSASELPKDEREVVEEGADGRRIAVYEITTKGGIETRTRLVSATILEPARERVIKLGRADAEELERIKREEEAALEIARAEAAAREKEEAKKKEAKKKEEAKKNEQQNGEQKQNDENGNQNQKQGENTQKNQGETNGNKPANTVATYTMEATAYDDSVEQNGPYGAYTASGTRLRPGVVAVDPKVIPLGTKLYVEGYGYAVAEDTGGAIKGMKIDLFMDTAAAHQFGRQKVVVHVLGK